MGVTSSTSQRGLTEVEPPWVRTLYMPPECASDHVGSVSGGMITTGATSLIRTRTGHFESDAARWSRGFTSGKHVFDIVFPDSQRGMEATVGVGTEAAPLNVKGKVPLVGFTKDSWGISLRTKRAFHGNVQVKKYPSTQIPLPDKFCMYLDADAGMLQFGTDRQFYGTALNNIPRSQPLYPMVSSCHRGAQISIAYRGTALSGAGLPPGMHVQMAASPGAHQQMVVMAPAGGATVISSTAMPPPGGHHGYPAPPPPYTPEENAPPLQAKQ